MMRKLIIIFFVLGHCAFAQNVNIDSLRIKIKELKSGGITDSTLILAQRELIIALRFTDPDEAMKQTFAGIEMAIRSKNPKMQETMYNQLGNLFYDQSKFDLALDAYYKSLKFSKSIPDTGAIAYTMNDIGYIFQSLSLLDLAEKYYRKAIQWSENHYEEEILAHSYNGLAWVFKDRLEFDSAYVYFDKAYKIRLKLGDNEKIAHSHSYLGLLELNNFKNYNKAIKHFEQSIKLYDLDKTWIEGKIYNYLYIGQSYWKLGDLEKAESNILKSINKFNELDYKKRISMAMMFYSQFLFENNRIDEALIQADSAFKIAKKFRYSEEKIESSEMLYKIYQNMNKYDSAFVFLKINSNMKDSLKSKQLIKQASIVETNIMKMDFQEENQDLKAESQLRLIVIVIIVIMAITLIVLVFNRYKYQKLNSQKLATINQRLEFLNIELEKANITKDRFFSIIAHDLKNPVGSLKGTIDILHKDLEIFDNEELQEYIQQLQIQSTGVKELLENLLTWSRSQSGKITLTPVDLNLSYLVRNNFHLLSGNAQKKGIILKNKVAEDFEFKADVNMINTVLRNLISNAIKFTPEGGKICVLATKGDSNVEIRVKDTGVGIPEDVLPKLFDIDSNVTTDGTNEEKGTGLGLIVCKEFIERHEGQIKVESEIGKGTEFIIILPT